MSGSFAKFVKFVAVLRRAIGAAQLVGDVPDKTDEVLMVVGWHVQFPLACCRKLVSAPARRGRMPTGRFRDGVWLAWCSGQVAGRVEARQMLLYLILRDVAQR